MATPTSPLICLFTFCVCMCVFVGGGSLSINSFVYLFICVLMRILSHLKPFWHLNWTQERGWSPHIPSVTESFPKVSPQEDQGLLCGWTGLGCQALGKLPGVCQALNHRSQCPVLYLMMNTSQQALLFPASSISAASLSLILTQDKQSGDIHRSINNGVYLPIITDRLCTFLHFFGGNHALKWF